MLPKLSKNIDSYFAVYLTTYKPINDLYQWLYRMCVTLLMKNFPLEKIILYRIFIFQSTDAK